MVDKGNMNLLKRQMAPERCVGKVLSLPTDIKLGMVKKAGTDKREWGQAMERIATEYLLEQGYVIRETNWSPPAGHVEIDIIAQRGEVIVFAEVKARSDVDAWPEEAVTPRKIKNIVKGASAYMSMLGHGAPDMPEPDYTYRFDIITLTGDPASYRLDHIEDAFFPPL